MKKSKGGSGIIGVELEPEVGLLGKIGKNPVMSNSDKTVIPRISVLSGGVGAEREVSLQSAITCRCPGRAWHR